MDNEETLKENAAMLKDDEDDRAIRLGGPDLLSSELKVRDILIRGSIIASELEEIKHKRDEGRKVHKKLIQDLERSFHRSVREMNERIDELAEMHKRLEDELRPELAKTQKALCQPDLPA